MKKFATLYAKASTGKVKVWEIEARGNIMVIKNGYIDGKMAEQTKVITGKNTGRSNETSDEKQCELECQSKWTKKIDEQYTIDKDDIVEYADQTVILPMLALKYEDRKHDIVFPCYVQPKLDGTRMIWQNGQCISRQGKVITTLEHIALELKELGLIKPDGEIFIQGDTFQELVRKVKKDRGAATDTLEYWIYDLVSNEDFSKRTAVIATAFKKNKSPHLKQVPTYLANSEEEINKYHNQFITEGFEGIIIRNAAGGYECKHRSKNLQKLKNFEDSEFIITGGKEAEGADAGTVVFECKTKGGEVFSVRPRGTRELRAQYLKDLKKLIGKELTVKYQGFSEDLKPRFPVGVAIRDYE